MFFPTTQLIFLLTFHKLFSIKLPTLAKRDFKNPSESKRLASESNSLAFYYLRQSKETLKTHRKANDSHRKAIHWRFTTYTYQKGFLKLFYTIPTHDIVLYLAFINSNTTFFWERSRIYFFFIK